MTTRVQESFAQLIEIKEYSPFLNTILEVIVANGIDPVAMFKFKEEKGIEDIARFKEFTIDVVLDYAELCLEDDILAPYEVSCIRDLQLLFRIDGEDYAALGKMERVHDLLIGQLEKLYEDNRIDASEVLVKGELQSLFGLGYSDFNAIAQQCAKEALERGANIKDLDIFLPYDQEERLS